MPAAAFDPSYRGGIFLAADDVNGDGRNDIIVSAGTLVKVIDGFKLAQVQSNGVISDTALITQFTAFPTSYSGKGISLAAGDLNADGKADIVLGAGPGGGSEVRILNSAKFAAITGDGQLPSTSELGHFSTFDSGFRGGVYVAVSKNVAARDVIVGAGEGGGPHVKVIAGSKITQVQGGIIADSALRANFFAYDPAFRGGVRVGADDLNFDGLAELTLSPGPSGGPHVKIVDGSKITQVQSDGVIAPAALTKSFFVGDPNFRGGVFIASDADHRDGTVFGPPNVTIANSRRDINDVFVFQSPTNPANSVLVLDVSPFSTAATPAGFAEGDVFDFRIANRDLHNTTDDLVFRVTFGPQDAAQGNRPDTVVRALPAAKFAGSGGVIVKTFTGNPAP
ncbi:hypothetical protein BH11PLA2_BH11PLA2_26430 [soil metagenome]